MPLVGPKPQNSPLLFGATGLNPPNLDPYGLAGSLAQYLRSALNWTPSQDVLNLYRANYREAAGARGFEGGAGPAAGEAAFLTNLTAQMQQQVRAQAAAQGVDFSTQQAQLRSQVPLAYGQFALEQRAFEEELRAAQEQSDFARAQYFQQQRTIDQWMRQNFLASIPQYGGGLAYPPPGSNTWRYYALGGWRPGNFVPAWEWERDIWGFASGPQGF